MIGWLIIACEVGFWVFVLAGLVTRYTLGRKKLGGILLLCTPIVDLVLIIATIIDLQNGQQATFFHGLAAYYIGMTVALGNRMIQWADARFAYRFADGEKPKKLVLFGAEHAKKERSGWYRHLLGWAIGNTLLAGMIIFIGRQQTEELLKVMSLWMMVLAADFIWSFSYTVFPKRARET